MAKTRGRKKKFVMPSLAELRRPILNEVRNRDIFVRDAIREYEAADLVEPYYQREFVWPLRKQQDFLQYTLETRQIVMPIVTYSLTNMRTTFLQDGKQRLTTLKRAIADPEKYGMQEAHVIELRDTTISMRHCHYENHDQGRIGFQKLNEHTGLAPFDLWRGEIDCTEAGRLLYEKVQYGVAHVTCKLAGTNVVHSVKSATGGKKRNGQLHRGALALFYMFASGTPVIQNILTHTNKKAEQPETKTAELLNARNWTEEDVDHEVTVFCRYLEDVVAHVNDTVSRVSPADVKKAWDEQAVRAIFNAAVYVRLRPNLQTHDFTDVLTWYLQNSAGFEMWKSRFDINHGGGKHTVRMSQHDLSWLQAAATFGGPDLISKRERASNSVRLKIGNDNSHIVPAALGGTITLPENALTNRSRGATPMTEAELANLTAASTQTTISFTDGVDN